MALQVRTLCPWDERTIMLTMTTAGTARPCHSTVHRTASNDDLAKSLYTVDLLLEREDIQRWRAAKQRFGVKRG